MSDARLKKLQAAWAEMDRLDESETYKGKENTRGGITPVPGYADKPIKGVGETRSSGDNDAASGSGPGAKTVDQEHGKEGPVEGAHPVNRKEGASAGEEEVGHEHGSEAAVEGAHPVNREQGAAAGKSEVGEYGDHESFRKRIKAALGMDLDDPKNKGYDKDGSVPADKSGSKR